MPDFTQQCFVCGKEVDPAQAKMNIQFNLPICEECPDTDREKMAIAELLDGMADGFVCGCI